MEGNSRVRSLRLAVISAVQSRSVPIKVFRSFRFYSSGNQRRDLEQQQNVLSAWLVGWGREHKLKM
jgi:hypothetical protein